MTILKKRLAMALSLALCVMPISAPLALAETNPSVESADATPAVGTTEATEISADPEIATEATEQVEVNDETGAVVSPGTLPDSPFYWLTTLIEKLQVMLTFDPVEKTELLEEQGLERIAEAAALIEQGDTEEAEATLKAYTEKIAEAQAFIAQLTEADSETRVNLEMALSKTQANNVQTLGGLLEKLPSQAAQRVALNIVRSMEKSISKMDKKDQQMVDLELKKATEGIGDSELAEEDVTALENLDQTLEESELEEDIVAHSDTTLNIMALAKNTSKDTITETSKTSSQSLVQNTKSKVSKPELKAPVELETTEQTKPQELKQATQDEGKALEQKQQEDKAEQESDLKEENPNLNDTTQKQDGEGTQQKVQKEREKGTKSGGKER